jgi:hypothetical protein
MPLSLVQVPHHGSRRNCGQGDRDPRVHRLCRLIGFGLMAVNAARDRIEVLAEPGPYRPRPDQRRRKQLLSEHARRRGDPSPGDSTRQPVMTAYRQQALACAALLRAGPARPRDLRAVAPDVGRILLRNVYGWFERTQRGVYRLTGVGETALQRWPGIGHTAACEGLARHSESVVGSAAIDAAPIARRV